MFFYQNPRDFFVDDNLCVPGLFCRDSLSSQCCSRMSFLYSWCLWQHGRTLVLSMHGFVSFAETIAVVSDSASIAEINAEPHLVSVAHFLATGLYGSKCADVCSK